MEKISSWNIGTQARLSVSGTPIFPSVYTSIRLEWLAKASKETGTSKLLFKMFRDTRDVSLESGEDAIFPVNRLLEISRLRRNVKFARQEGSIPSKLLLPTLSSWRFLKWHQSAEEQSTNINQRNMKSDYLN